MVRESRDNFKSVIKPHETSRLQADILVSSEKEQDMIFENGQIKYVDIDNY